MFIILITSNVPSRLQAGTPLPVSSSPPPSQHHQRAVQQQYYYQSQRNNIIPARVLSINVKADTLLVVTLIIVKYLVSVVYVYCRLVAIS